MQCAVVKKTYSLNEYIIEFTYKEIIRSETATWDNRTLARYRTRHVASHGRLLKPIRPKNRWLAPVNTNRICHVDGTKTVPERK